MGQLSDRLAAHLADIDSRIEMIKLRASSEIAVLQRQREVLLKAGTLVSADLEAAYDALQKIGVLM